MEPETTNKLTQFDDFTLHHDSQYDIYKIHILNHPFLAAVRRIVSLPQYYTTYDQ